MRRLQLALALGALVAAPPTASAQLPPAAYPTVRASPVEPPSAPLATPRTETDPDPLVLAAVPGLVGGGFFTVAGALGLAFDRSPSSGWGASLFAGGATALGGGATLLAAGLLAPPDHADAGRGRLAASGMIFGLGGGLVVTSLVGRPSRIGREPSNVLLGSGATAMGLAAPLLIWGAATNGDDAAPSGWAPTRFASGGRMVTGTTLLALGMVATPASLGLLTMPTDCGGPCPELLGGGLLLAAGVTGFAVGIPLYAAGADVERRVWPTLHYAGTSAHASWTLD